MLYQTRINYPLILASFLLYTSDTVANNYFGMVKDFCRYNIEHVHQYKPIDPSFIKEFIHCQKPLHTMSKYQLGSGTFFTEACIYHNISSGGKENIYPGLLVCVKAQTFRGSGLLSEQSIFFNYVDILLVYAPLCSLLAVYTSEFYQNCCCQNTLHLVCYY